jgi:crotonobetainyl-CoA:carnitine CoA-transferase CaiB-like acyl-CoA transferase
VKSGKGQHIDLALYDCLVSMHEYAVQMYTMSGGKEVPAPTGHDLPTSTLYGVFSAQDGPLVIAAQVDDAWKRFARLAGGDAFADDTRFHTAPGRNANRLEILPVARAWVARHTVADALAQLDAIDVPAAKVQRIDETLADPQLIARGMVLEQDHPLLGKIQLPNLPFRFSDCDTTCTVPAPLLGQHNREVAGQLGFGDAEIDAMERDGVLYAEEAVASLHS